MNSLFDSTPTPLPKRKRNTIQVGVVYFNRMYRVQISVKPNEPFMSSFIDSMRFVAAAEYVVNLTTYEIIKSRMDPNYNNLKSDPLKQLLQTQPPITLRMLQDIEEKHGNILYWNRKQRSPKTNIL